MKRNVYSALILFFLLTAFLFAENSAPPAISGIWQNNSRFIEFSADTGMRVALKTYYGFVYEKNPWIPCAIHASTTSAEPESFTLTVRYAGEKEDSSVPVALLSDSLFFKFYRKISAPGSDANSLEGFYQSEGNAEELRLYRSEPSDEFYCYYFTGKTYYRIRYWAADVRFKDISAEFKSPEGTLLTIPKFIRIGGVLYTCITSTGRNLRNHETGTFTVTNGFLSFKPTKTVFAGTAAFVSQPVRLTISADGTLIALGEPYLVRAKITDLDAEIKTHNALRRPHRKPIFGFMDLNFYWDEIDRLRNGSKLP